MKGKVSVSFYRTVMVFTLLWSIAFGYAWHYIATLPSTVQPHPEYDYSDSTFEWMSGEKFEAALRFHGLEDTGVIFRDGNGRLKFWRDGICSLYTEDFEKMWEGGE